jgi:hypothetical protein
MGARYRNLSDDVEVADGVELESPFAEVAKTELDQMLAARITSSLGELSDVPESWREVLARRPIKISIVASDPDEASHWLVGVDPAHVTRRPIEPEAGFAWSVTAEATALRDVLSGELNLASAIRQRRIRVSDLTGEPQRDTGPGRDTERDGPAEHPPDAEPDAVTEAHPGIEPEEVAEGRPDEQTGSADESGAPRSQAVPRGHVRLQIMVYLFTRGAGAGGGEIGGD